MLKQDKNGKKTLEWLEERRSFLEDKYPSVKWYIKFSKQTREFQQELIERYNKYLDESQHSEAKKLFNQIKSEMKNKNMELVRKLAALAREKLANEDYKNAPATYDPVFIETEFFVRMYIEVQSEINKEKSPFMRSVETALL